MSEKICPKCGEPNPAEMSFCTNCGQTLTAPAANAPGRPEEPPPTVFISPTPPAAPRQPVASPPTPQISSNPPGQPPKKSSKAWMFGVAGCLGLLIVSVVGLVIVVFALGYSDLLGKKDEPNRDFPNPSPTQRTNSNSVFNTRLSDSSNTTRTDTDDVTPTDDDLDSGAFLVSILEKRKQVGRFNQTSAKSLATKDYFPLANGAAQAEYSNGSKYVYLTVGKFSSLDEAKENFDEQIDGIKANGGQVTYENTASDGTISAIYNNKGFYFAEYCNTNAFCNRIHSNDQAALKNFFENYAK